MIDREAIKDYLRPETADPDAGYIDADNLMSLVDDVCDAIEAVGDGSELVDDAVTQRHLAPDSVGSSELRTDSVGSSELKPGAVQAGNLDTPTAGLLGSVLTRTLTGLAWKRLGSVSVMDFGATGDGVTDDTAALQAAVDYAIAEGKQLLLPPGTYKYSGLNNINRRAFSLRGASSGTVTLLYTGEGRALSFDAWPVANDPNQPFLDSLDVGGFTIVGAQMTNGIYLRGVARSYFSDVRVNGSGARSGATDWLNRKIGPDGTVAFNFEAAQLCAFAQLRSSYVNGDTPYRGLRLAPGTRANINAGACSNNIFSGLYMEGMHIGAQMTSPKGGDQNVFLGGAFEACRTYGSVIGVGCRYNFWVGTGFENPSANVDIAEAGIQSIYWGCYASHKMEIQGTGNPPSRGTGLYNGMYERIQINAGAQRVRVEGCTVNNWASGAGGLIDNGTGTTIRDVYDEDTGQFMSNLEPFPLGALTDVDVSGATNGDVLALDGAAWEPLTLATVAKSGAYGDLTGRPTLGSAAALNVGTAVGTVAAGDDPRLSDARTPPDGSVTPRKRATSWRSVTSDTTITVDDEVLIAGAGSYTVAAPATSSMAGRQVTLLTYSPGSFTIVGAGSGTVVLPSRGALTLVKSSGSGAWVVVSGQYTNSGGEAYRWDAGVSGVGGWAKIVTDLDARLSDTRVPTDESVTDVKIPANAGISPSKIAGVALVASTIDAKGDLIIGTADNTVARLPAPADGRILVADSQVSTGWTGIAVGNMFWPNVATGTDTLGTTAGYTIGGATGASVTSQQKFGSRSLELTATGAALSAYGEVTGIIPGQEYTFLVWAMSPDTAVNFRAAINWRSAANTTISTAFGNSQALTSGFGLYSITDVAPAGAVAAQGSFVRVSTNPAAGARIYADAWSFHLGRGSYAPPGYPIPQPAIATPTRYALRTTSSGNYVSAPASAAAYAGVVEMEATWIGVYDVLPAANTNPISHWQGGGQDAWGITVGASDILYYTVASGAVSSFATWSGGTTTAITAGAVVGIRLVWRANNGSGVPDMRLFTSADEGVWTLRATDTAAAAATLNASVNASLSIMANGVGANPVNGRAIYARVRTNTGSGLVERASWTADTARGPRDSDPQGNVWTINGSAWSWRTR